MNRLTSIVFFLLVSSSVFSQEINALEFEKIDKLILLENFKQVKSDLAKLEKTTNLSIINLHKIYEYKIRVARLEKIKTQEIELMKMYVFNPKFDSVFIKSKRFERFNYGNDTSRIYINKSTYSKQLANYYHGEKNYSNALKFLNIHETKYLYHHPCGNGRVKDNLERQIISGEIHQNLGNHKMVLKKLLPLTFDHSIRAVKGIYEKRVDSILMISLHLKYTKKQIFKEFEKCMKLIPDEGPDIYLNHETEIKMFDTTFSINTVKRNQYNEERRRETFEIRDNEKRKEVEKDIYIEAYKKAFRANRIYKIVS
jgi:hypothetical protein